MRSFLFLLFKIFKRIENQFYKQVRNLLLRHRASTGTANKVPKTNSWYLNMAVCRRNIFDGLYKKLKPDGIVWLNVDNMKMYIDTDDMSFGYALLMEGAWERYKTDLFKTMVKEGMIVADVGANVGYYSLIAANLVGKSGVVYAFEPEPNNYALFSRNVQVNNCANIIAVQKAVSDRAGQATLWFEKEQKVNPSFSSENAMVSSRYKGLDKAECTTVDTISLDGFFESQVGNYKVDFIKVDTEGAEGLMVDGADKILRGNRNLKIILEFWPDGLTRLGTNPQNLLRKLEDYNFRIKRIDDKNQKTEQIGIVELCNSIEAGGGVDLLFEKNP